MSPETPPFRIGSVEYLNAVPLTRGIESEVIFATPRRGSPKCSGTTSSTPRS